MKILNKQEFLKLGVCLFCKGKQWAFDSLCLKGDTIYYSKQIGDSKVTENHSGDFYYTELCQIESTGTNDLFDKMQEMLVKGESQPMNQDLARDGCYDNDDIFLVFEPQDIAHLYCIVKVLVGYSGLSMEHFKDRIDELKCKKWLDNIDR